MALAGGDILVYDGSQWNNQPGTGGGSADLTGPFSVDSPTFYVKPSNHRVGIGTTSPNAKLEVYGPSVEIRLDSNGADQSLTLRFFENNTTTKGRVLYAGGNPAGSRYTGILNDNGDWLMLGTLNTTDIRFWADNTERMRLTSGGSLGVGTTSPDFKVDVNGDVRIIGSNKLFFGGSGSSDNDTNLFREAANKLRTNDALVIDGDVGIGTTSPSTNLDIVGTTGIKSSSVSGGNCRLAYTGGSPQDYNLHCLTDGSFRITDETASSTQRLRLSAGLGYFCIGTGSATSKLQVEGPIATAVTNVTTSPYTVTATDSVVRVGTDGGAITVNLPTASGITGRQYTIKRVSGANDVTITPNGSETIDGADNYLLGSLYQSVILVSDGTNWAVAANTGLLYGNTTVPGGNTVANTATQTNFTSNLVLPADSLTVGKSLQIVASGTYGTKASSPGTLTLRFRLGSITVAGTAALTPTVNLSNRGWMMTLEVTVTAVGGSGSVEAQGVAQLATSTTAATVHEMVNAAPVMIDTTGSNTAQVSAEWSTADAANSITLRLLKIRVDN